MAGNRHGDTPVWQITWNMGPACDWERIPEEVLERVERSGLVLGVDLVDAYADFHDDLDGGDPDLRSWRFLCAVPGTEEPEPGDRVTAAHAVWEIPPGQWPDQVSAVAEVVAEVATRAGRPGHGEILFAPAMTRDLHLERLLYRAYGRELTLVERATLAERDRVRERLPEARHPWFNGAENETAGTVDAVWRVVVGEYENGYRRVVQAGLELPDHQRAEPLGALDPVLVVPEPPGPARHRWLVTVDGERFAGTAPTCAHALAHHLDTAHGLCGPG